MKTRSGTQAVSRAFRVLEALALGPGTASEISDRVGFARPTTSRLLNALCAERYAMRDERRVYSLGSRFLELAYNQASFHALGKTIQPYVDELQRLSGETVHAAMREGVDCVCIAVSESQNPIRLTLTVGKHQPLHTGAVARTILAHSPQPIIDEVLEGPLTKFTPTTPVDAAELHTLLEETRERGYSTSHGELDDFASAIAAPVFGDPSGILLCIGISGPSHRMSDETLNKLVKPLLEVTGAASNAMRSHLEGHAIE